MMDWLLRVSDQLGEVCHTTQHNACPAARGNLPLACWRADELVKLIHWFIHNSRELLYQET